jgi:hypothetical protein
MFSKKPLQQQTVAAPPTLNTDKEVELLIKSIEESSKLRTRKAQSDKPLSEGRRQA